ncbi:TetR/AcrR family transcriptional regulator [Antrihabitans sp. YC2-6]|uniref:TetR/AcrR family transcriptional regulator n=1 Tax=Antrihabitans sp. YC2-6 TaxID=2799498 RepID=UPI001F44D875|nr:TetR/AcrR family transcriptional regulator [Antrihabitans sp. YC2-6]
MVVHKPVGRAEAREQTREQVLAAAEELFIANGFHATTVAQIAAKAGRTQGAIYGNFAGKEALCLDVIRRRYMATFGEVAVSLAAAVTFDDKMAAFTAWWEELADQEDLTILVGEYMLAARRDPAQLDALADYFELVKTTIRAIVSAHFEGEGAAGAVVEDAMIAVLALGTGLALGRAGGLVSAADTSHVFTETIRLWRSRIGAAALT